MLPIDAQISRRRIFRKRRSPDESGRFDAGQFDESNPSSYDVIARIPALLRMRVANPGITLHQLKSRLHAAYEALSNANRTASKRESNEMASFHKAIFPCCSTRRMIIGSSETENEPLPALDSYSAACPALIN
jgi:hypothetical protein